MDTYFRVNTVQMSADSNLDSRGQTYFTTSRRKSGSDFGNIFISACDELNQKSGITHPNRAYGPDLMLALH